MAFTLIVRAEAEEDIEDSALWYERRQQGLGARFSYEVDQLLKRIVDTPLQFPQIEKGVRRGLLRHFPHGVYFTNDADRIVILAVLHLRRHPDTWKQRL